MELSRVMPSLAIALIVKNEAANLGDCLTSCAGLADEIVVIDGGSDDDTVEIARSHGATVHVNKDWQGFGQQRRVAQQHVRADWVLWLDADERLTPALRVSIQQAMASADSRTVFAINRLSWVFGRFIRHSGWYPDQVVRLYPTALTRYSEATVHEHVIVPSGVTIRTLAGDLEHYTYRDMRHYLVKSAHYAHLWAVERQRQGKHASLAQGLIHGLGCFLKMYVLKAGFLDGQQGLLLALLSAHSTFAKYADLWVRQQPGRP